MTVGPADDLLHGGRTTRAAEGAGTTEGAGGRNPRPRKLKGAMVNPGGGSVEPGSAALRTAFQLKQLHAHRNPKSLITSVALNQSSEWLYLGLSDGHLEEHRLEINPTPRCSLSARKAVGKKAIEEIHHLVGARRLAVLSDGVVSLLDCDSLDDIHLPGLKGVTAIGSNGSDAYPSRLAVATKVVLTTRKRARLSLFKVRGGSVQGDPGGAAMLTKALDLEETHSLRRLAWVGGAMIAATNYRYLIVSLRDGNVTHLFELHGGVGQASPKSPILAPFSATETAMLIMEQVGMVVNSSGQPTGGTLAFSSEPLAVAQCGIYILAFARDSITIYDQVTAAGVQSLTCELAEEGADIWASAAGTASGSCIAVATRKRVWLLNPVGLEEQARELLRQRQFEAARSLACCAGQGGGAAPWKDICIAESALLLLADLQFQEAVEALLRVPLDLLGPVHLFPLFPEATEPWLSSVTGPKLWGVAPLPGELRGTVRANLGDAPPGAIEEAILGAKRAMASYMAEVRKRSDASPADGIDTLLLQLLVDTEDVAGVEALAAAPNLVSIPNVERVLEGAGRSHALALLLAAHGRHSAALRIWQELAVGKRGEASALSGAIANAKASGAADPAGAVAVGCACDLMLAGRDDEGPSGTGRGEVPVRMVMQYLPWVLGSGANMDPGDNLGLKVMCARTLPVAEALKLLEGRHAHLRWRYLLHAVRRQGDQDRAHHTELATLLCDAVLKAAEGTTAGGAELQRMRAELQGFLTESELYNVAGVLRKLQGTSFWHEQVILHSKTRNHSAALRLLATQINDFHAALEYCEDPGREGCHLQLLRILLSPGDGREPLLQEACMLLNCKGGSELDPMEVLDAMSPDLPLQRALPTLARILRERIHRARDRRLVCSLERSVNLEAKGKLAEAQQQRVLMTDERACPTCHTRIGTRMFASLPGGAVQCYRCYQKTQGHVQPAEKP